MVELRLPAVLSCREYCIQHRYIRDWRLSVIPLNLRQVLQLFLVH